MTDSPMTCDMLEALIHRDLEGELSSGEQSAVARHLAGCGRCRTLREDLVEIIRSARHLPALSPARDLWTGVAARIEAPVIVLGGPSAQRTGRPRRLRLGAAAAAIMAFTATTTFVATRAAYDASSTTATASTAGPVRDPAIDDSPHYPPGRSIGGAILVANQQPSQGQYEREVAKLRELFDRRRPLLDSATVAVLEWNLRVIDKAIADSRAALVRNPNSSLLNRQLNNALGKKMQVLRTAALLPSAAE